MEIIEFLKKSLEGRGLYPIFMVIYSWINAIILFVIFICEIFLYIFKVRIPSKDFKNRIDNKDKK